MMNGMLSARKFIFIRSLFFVCLLAAAVLLLPKGVDAASCTIPAISGSATETYDFDSDTIGQVPANVTEQYGTFEVANDATFGKSLHPLTSETSNTGANSTADLAVGLFDNVASTNDITVTYQHRVSSSWDIHGFILRHDSTDGSGYLFQVRESDVRILLLDPDLGGNHVQELATGTLSDIGTTPRWYKLSVQSNTLEVCYSDDGGSTYEQVATASNATITGGTVAYTAGYSSGNEALNYVDDISIEYADTAPGGSCTIGAISGSSTVTYDFDSDTLGQTPSNFTEQYGTFEVANDATFGNSLHPLTKEISNTGYQSNAEISVGIFDSVASADDVTVTYQHRASSSWDHNGIALRYDSLSGEGYFFQIKDTELLLFRFDNDSPNDIEVLATGALSDIGVTPRWYKVSVQGTSLVGCYSDDGGSTYNQLVSVTDANFTAGSVAYMSGFSSGDTTLNYVDDVDIEYTSTDSLSISSPTQYQIFQRDGSDQYDLVVSGTYAGSPTAIEYQLDGGSWSTLDASPAGGTFSGTLNDLAVGEHTIAVRHSNDTGITDSVANVRVGDVFGAIGQSNMRGRITNGQPYTGTAASVFDDGGNWDNLGSNYIFDGDYHIMPLLASLIEAETGVPVGFIIEAQGGTGLLAPDADWSSSGTNYNEWISRVTNSGVNDLAGVLWYQGEKDIVNSTAQATYAAAESNLIDRIQADTGFTNTILISANIAMYVGEGASEINAIRLAKIGNWNTDADIYAGATGHDQDFADGLHWMTDAEAVTQAGRWFRGITAVLFGSSESGRGPQFSSAEYSGDELTVTFTGGVGSLTNQSDTTGWSVTDGSGSRTIQSATGTSSTVTLTLDQALVDPVTVSFANGNEAIGSTLVDSGTYPMPPEPFISQSASLAASSGGSGGGSEARIPSVSSVSVVSCTSSENLHVYFSGTNIQELILSEDEDFLGATWMPYSVDTSLEENYGDITLSSEDGEKTVYVMFRSSSRNKSSIYSVTTTLDQEGLCLDTEPDMNEGEEIEEETENETDGIANCTPQDSIIPYEPEILTDTSSIEPGDYIRGVNFSTVYLIDENLHRKPFIHRDIYLSYRCDFKQVKWVEDGLLADFALGNPVLPASSVLLKFETDNKVYISSKDPNDASRRILRWIESEEMAEALLGTEWNKYIMDINPALQHLYDMQSPYMSIEELLADPLVQVITFLKVRA